MVLHWFGAYALRQDQLAFGGPSGRVLAVIATGLIVPGRNGDLIGAGGLTAFAGIVVFELGGFWSVRRGSRNDRTRF